MANEAQKILDEWLERLRRNERVRKLLAGCLVLVLLGVAASFLHDALPRQYALTLTGGDILGNRHFVARQLQRVAADHGVALKLNPMPGSEEALRALDAGQIDLAFIQDGLENKYPNVVHVASVVPEQLHFLVKPDIKDISGLRGKLVNLGSKRGGTRIVARQVLEFSGLEVGVDYVEANLSAEELLRMRAERLPDAIVITSYAPSDGAEFLIRERGYTLLEIPFPASLALRLGWVADSKILAYTYSVKPPVPPRDIKTVGVNMHLVANRNVEPRAIFQVLESLYSPALSAALKLRIDEDQLNVPSGYPLSEGSQRFLERKNPLLSSATLDRIKALFGLALSVASTVLVVLRWFQGDAPEAPKPQADDPRFVAWLQEVAGIEQAFASDPVQRASLLQQLLRIKTEALACLGQARLDNPALANTLLTALADTRSLLLHDASTGKDTP